ncbi:MAG: hypothetical protein HYY85_12850 [Deltaproteobacteria bacterium]|nr:hypothetical protein [Deltaproteobacteria bacterium]
MVAFTASPAPAQDGQADALANRMIEAAGGMAAWDRMQDVSFKLTVIPHNPQGEPAAAAVSVYWLKRPYRGRMETLDENGHLVLGFDGEKAWGMRNGKPVTDATTLKRAQFLPLNWWYWLGIPFKLKDPGVVLAHKGTATLQGRQVERLEATFRPGTGATSSDRYLYYVNPQTARVELVEFWLQEGVWPGAGGARHGFWSDYQKVGDITTHTRRVAYGDRERRVKASVLLFSAFKVNQGIPDSMVKAPESSRPSPGSAY